MTRMIATIQLMIAIAATPVAMANAQSIRTQINPESAVTIAAATNAIAGSGFGALPQKDELLAGTEKFAQGARSVTEINLDPTTLSMMSNHGRDAELAHKMTLMVVHTYSYDKPGMYRQEDVDAFRKKLEDGSWSCFVHTRSESGSSDICSRAGADHETNEMVIFSCRPEKLTFIHMSGKMSLEELSQMSGHANGFSIYSLSPLPMPLIISTGPREIRVPKEPKEPKDPKEPKVKYGKEPTAPTPPTQPAAPALPATPPQ